MKLKNKYSKQNIYIYIYIYSNQKFEDQIWYNQQIMIFLNFSQLPKSIFPLLLESVFHWPTLLLANKHKKVWKVISRKLLSGKQTQLKGKHFPENKTKFFID